MLGEDDQLDKCRECQNHQQRSGDRFAYAAPPQRGAHEEAVVTCRGYDLGTTIANNALVCSSIRILHRR